LNGLVLGKILGRLVRLSLRLGGGRLAEERVGLVDLSVGVEERVVTTDGGGKGWVEFVAG
jgi:hypothetical protein